MNSQRANVWFRVKRYGYGWGIPARWQGWAVLVAYFALLYAGIRYLGGRQSAAGLILYMLVITLALIAIVIAKGERPLRWRWGED